MLASRSCSCLSLSHCGSCFLPVSNHVTSLQHATPPTPPTSPSLAMSPYPTLATTSAICSPNLRLLLIPALPHPPSLLPPLHYPRDLVAPSAPSRYLVDNLVVSATGHPGPRSLNFCICRSPARVQPYNGICHYPISGAHDSRGATKHTKTSHYHPPSPLSKRRPSESEPVARDAEKTCGGLVPPSVVRRDSVFRLPGTRGEG